MNSTEDEPRLDGWTVLVVAGWIAYLMVVRWIADRLRLSYRRALALWGLCNAAPAAWSLFVHPVSVGRVAGLLVVVGTSWVLGRAAFDHRERERRAIQKLVDAGDVVLNERSTP